MPSGIYERKIRYPCLKKTRKKISEALKGRTSKNNGEKCYNWRGGNVGYHTLHNWLRYTKGRPKKCNSCGIENKLKSDGRNYIEWANIDHKYRRKLQDYIPLCCKCHKEYDALIKKNNLIIKN